MIPPRPPKNARLRKKLREQRPLELVADRPDAGSLRRVAGSRRDTFNNITINAALAALWKPTGQSEEQQTKQYEAAIVAMMAFKPTDEIEGMIVAQAVALHATVMECSRRAMIPDQPFEAAQSFRKAAANASRAFNELLTALDRKRGKNGQQKVTVEHVHIHSGGNAIVGNVEAGAARGGGGVARKCQYEPDASPARLANDIALGAVLPPVRSADAERPPVPVSGDAQRAMSDARWRKHGATNG